MSTSLLRAALVADSGVTAIAGTNIFAITAPQGIASPHAIIQQVSADPARQHTGSSGIALRSFQVACFGSTFELTISLRNAVIAALDGVELSSGESASVDDERDFDFDDGANLYRADADFTV